MIKLLAETPRDQEMIDKFRRAYENLEKFVEKQNRRIRELEEEFNEYKKRHPSTVGVKNSKTYAIKEEKAEEPQAGFQSVQIPESKPVRKQGAQQGHRGHYRSIPAITKRIIVKASEITCPKCHSTMVKRGMRKRIIEDIPVIREDVVQYRIERMYCRHCKGMFEPDIKDAFPDARFSIRVMLIAAYLKIAMRMSIESVSSTMNEIFGLHISDGEIQGILYRLSESLGSEYDSLMDTVRNAPSRHMDTTSWTEDGKSMDLWAFVTKGEAVFHIAQNNGHEVALDVLGVHVGTDVHDRFSAFETLASKTENAQQYCWSHIICDAKELEDFYGDEGRRIKVSLQRIYGEAKSFHGKGTLDDVNNLHEKLTFLLVSDYDHKNSRKFVENLLKRKKEWLFRFVIDPEVEPTNNRAERALRPAVIDRKVSGGTRSSKGSKAYETLHSVFYTRKLRKKSILKDVPSAIDRKRRPHPG